MKSLTVVKRNGREEPFELSKLVKSVHAALNAAGLNDASLTSVMDDVLNSVFNEPDKVPSSKISDFVEKAFITRVVEDPRYEVAGRYYLLARIYNDVFGKGKWSSFDPDDLRLTYYALRVLMSRYLRKDPNSGRFLETPKALFERVARFVASAEKPESREYWFNEFLRLMKELRFIPNSPTLMNAGTKLGILSACFVLPVRDAMVTPENDGIYDAVRAQAIIFQQGGGCGFNFSELRPEGDVVASTAGVASGPLSFMKLFDVNTEVVKQGGRRRGANMGVLHVWHPDIKKFIKAKSGEGKDAVLQNFNISVGMYDYFMKALNEGKPVPLINPRKTSLDKTHNSLKYAVVWARHYMDEEWVQEVIIDELEMNGGSIPLENSLIITWDEALAIAEAEGAIVAWEDPKAIFEEIVKNAWESGDPGLLFIDTINRRHPTWYLGKINATNPCVSGETRVLTPKGWRTAREVWEEAKKHGVEVKTVVADEKVLGEGGEPIAYETTLVAPVGESAVRGIAENKELKLKIVAPQKAWVWYVGRKPALKVVTKEGYEVTVTYEHRFLTPEGWKEARELRPGDAIALARMHPEYVGRALTSTIKLDSDVAFALGWLVGNGALSKDYVAWHFKSGDGAAFERVKQAIAKLGGNSDGNAVLDKAELTLKFGSGTSAYKKVVELIGEIPPYQHRRRLPEIAWKLDLESLKSFLRGLFTANGATGFDDAIRLTNASSDLLKDVQILLTTIGIFSEIYSKPHDRKFSYATANDEVKVYEASEYYELTISNYSRHIFTELVGFESLEKTTELKLSKAESDPVWVSVERVEDAGVVDFYDFTVPEVHAYIAAGLIHHNCGEEPLLEWEACNLGSINLEKYVTSDGRIDWVGLGKDVEVAVRFLDNVIDVARFLLPQIEERVRRTRKVGLGVMGWAHMLVKLGIPYDSVDAVYLAYHLAEWIAYNAYRASLKLAIEKGPFPAWNSKLYKMFWSDALPLEEIFKASGVSGNISSEVKKLVFERPSVNWRELESEVRAKGLRNAAVLSIAPTGTVSIIGGTSSSIEPIFALAFTRVVTVGTFIEVNPLFLEALRLYGLDNPEVVGVVAESGSVRGNPFIPKKLREVFPTAHDIEPIWHILHQAAWQQWVDAGVSKTINMRAEATVEDVRKAYMTAWVVGCKGITVYRDKSKTQQVIYFGAKLTKKMSREGKELEEPQVKERVIRKSEEAEHEVEPKQVRKDLSRYRITRYVLKEGESGECPTCEY
ncbi:MAG: hypothetical protein B7O98_05380 [Zestosphaera tikiterensis]|uniref:Ribonucleoside-diphosphate reductase n=1 Tax=Zestosphaera tikiterensis TaxID=1973259 RepID=A0A2R7Y5Q2_9CREN|nr:MAG: hypothetical protein B7O98_05380 [Zestosphaera tikiterensis]